MRRLILLMMALCATTARVFAQDLTGTWEGTEEGNYMKLVIVKVGNEYVGYTYDTDPSGGWCRANFRAVFRPEARQLRGQGEGMIARKGSHVECSYDLKFLAGRDGDLLSGSERTKGAVKPLFDFFDFDEGPVELRRITRRVDTTEYMRRFLPKPPAAQPVTTTPQKTPPPVTRTPAPPATRLRKPATVPPRKTAPPVAKTTPRPAAPARKDSLVTLRGAAVKTAPAPKPVVTAPVAARNPLLALRKARSNNVVQEISTPQKQITIRVFDNGMPDGDTVSILHNDEVLFDHKLVAVQSFSFTVKLDDSDPVHNITLIAHNVGSIPPNTASIVVEAGDERYRLTASTDLQRNAVIRIVYKP